MIDQIIPGLAADRIVLASTSPRRRQILAMVGLHPLVVDSGFDEARLDRAAFATPAEFVQASAFLKAAHASLRCTNADLIVTADTVVVHDGRILEKPSDDDDARRMLSALSDGKHVVLTGVSMLIPGTAAAGDGLDLPSWLEPASHLVPERYRGGQHQTWVSADVSFAIVAIVSITVAIRSNRHWWSSRRSPTP